MSISVYRTIDGWWAGSSDSVARVETTATTTAALLADRAAIEGAVTSSNRVATATLELLSPVTAPCRVIAQMTNFASHVLDTGGDPKKTVPLTFFRKASGGSITGPYGDIVKPAHVRLLDYEVEIGLVIGRDVPVGTTITADNLADYVCGIVVTNDVSARDVQLTKKTQFYEPSPTRASPPRWARRWFCWTPTRCVASTNCACNSRSTASRVRTARSRPT